MKDGHRGDAFLAKATQALHEQFGIAHATLQIEETDRFCALECDHAVYATSGASAGTSLRHRHVRIALRSPFRHFRQAHAARRADRSDVAEAMREVRRALLEADVALEVVQTSPTRCATRRSARRSCARSRRARWSSRSSTTSWSRCSAPRPSPIDLNAPPPVAIMMVGLQGSGKTTTTAKIAKRLTERDKARC